MFFFVTPVTAGVDADGGEFAAFAPAFDGEGRDAQDFGDFADGEEIGEVVEIKTSGFFVGLVIFCIFSRHSDLLCLDLYYDFTRLGEVVW